MNKSRSALFLMELIIVIFFFSLTSAVCLNVFAKAHIIGRDTRQLNDAVLFAKNAGELFYEYGTDFEDHKDLVLENVPDEYDVTIDIRTDDNFAYMDYACYTSDGGALIYSLECKLNIQEVSGQ